MSLLRSPTPSASAACESSLQCSICKELLLEDQDCLIISQCAHSFHRACIEKHLYSSSECPTCKRPCELSELRNLHTQNENSQISLHEGIDVRSTNQANQKSKNTIRGRGRGTTAKHYNTRSTIRNLLPDLHHQGDSVENADDQTGGNMTPINPNTSRVPTRNQNTPQRRLNVENNIVDYDRISQMIELSVTRIFQNLSTNNTAINQNRPDIDHITQVQQHVNNSDVPNSSRHMASNISSHSYVGTDKITSIIRNWNLQFDGSAKGLDVEEFIYRLKSLTADNFDNDYSAICKNLHILLSGKAREWFWRYRKQVQTIVWEDFCAALRYQYKDFKTDADIREELRSRKQKPGESFELFFDSVSTILDRLTTPIEELELIEIIKRNLRPEIRHELLYVPIFSMAHLRKLIQMRENLFNDDACRRHVINKTMTTSYPRKNIAELEFPLCEDSDIDNHISVDAIKIPSAVPKCWNCDEPGHLWVDCLKDRSIFCYGCGAKNTYKPNCEKCANIKLNPHKTPVQQSNSKNH